MTTFPEVTKKFPLPTTCCWVPVEMAVDLIHIQYFVLLDFGLGFDVWSDIFQRYANKLGLHFMVP